MLGIKYLRISLLIAGIAALTVIEVRPTESASTPNVVLIMADDVSWEAFGSYGAVDYKTPNLDRLAAEGVRFRHCYSTPLCTPSRVMIMTGKYNFRNYTHFGYLNPREKTIGHLMKDKGYHTAIAGKWQLNGIYDNDIFPDATDSSRPNKAGFDEYCLWQLTKAKNAKDGGERFWSPVLEHNGKLLTKEMNHNKYGPDIMSEFLMDFMTRHKDEPFFVYYPSVLVHDPFVPTPDSIDERPRTHDMNRQPKDAGQRKENFVAMVEYLDRIVGRIITHLEKLDLLENTLILFTADNGTHRSIQSNWGGRTIQGGKGGLTDMGTHVPLIAAWKGHILSGAVVDDLVDFTDIYPTLAEVAGHALNQEDPHDGRSLLPVLKGEKGSPREWILCHYQPYWGPEPGLFARTAEFKLHGDGRFINVPKDLDEKYDLTQTPLVERVAAIRNKLDALLKKVPAVPGDHPKTDRPTHPDWPGLDLKLP